MLPDDKRRRLAVDCEQKWRDAKIAIGNPHLAGDHGRAYRAQ